MKVVVGGGGSSSSSSNCFICMTTRFTVLQKLI